MPDEPYPPLPPLPPRGPRHRRLEQFLTNPMPLPRWGFIALFILLIVPPRDPIEFPGFDLPSFPENYTIYIHDLDRTIDARDSIREQCAASVDSVGEGGNYVVFNGEEFIRWSVKPKPGHVDQVWLSQRTGKVVCP